jgi:prepilin-type N-terminal cleavage/methylation domain-containing protein
MYKKFKNLLKGFTLIELIVGISILAVLASVFLANFNHGTSQKAVALAADSVVSSIRTAETKSQSGQILPGISCSAGNQVAEYHLVFMPGEKTYTLVEKDKCNIDHVFTTYTLPANVRLATNGFSIDGAEVLGVKIDIKLLPPFGAMSVSQNNGPYVPFKYTIIKVEYIDSSVSREIGLDGITGRVETDTILAKGSVQPPRDENTCFFVSSTYPTGTPVNMPLHMGSEIGQIASTSLEYFSSGVDLDIIGTKAVIDPDIAKDLVLFVPQFAGVIVQSYAKDYLGSGPGVSAGNAQITVKTPNGISPGKYDIIVYNTSSTDWTKATDLVEGVEVYLFNPNSARPSESKEITLQVSSNVGFKKSDVTFRLSDGSTINIPASKVTVSSNKTSATFKLNVPSGAPYGLADLSVQFNKFKVYYPSAFAINPPSCTF